MNSDTEHRIHMGYYEDGASESDARKLFREITVEDVKQAYRPFLGNVESMVQILGGGQRQYRLPLERQPDLYAVSRVAPEMVALYHLIENLEGDNLVQQAPDIFRALIDRSDVSTEQLLNRAVGLPVVTGTERTLRLAIVAAFTRVDKRGQIDRTNWNGFRDHEYAQIISSTPDLTHHNTAERRLDEVIKMLTITYDEALSYACYTYLVSPEDLVELKFTNHKKYSEIHRMAGISLCKENLYACITDRLNNGKNNVFKVNPASHEGPQTTDLGRCPAAPLVDTWFRGVGELMKENKASVLHAVTAYNYYGIY